jgi:hypothetical protein
VAAVDPPPPPADPDIQRTVHTILGRVPPDPLLLISPCDTPTPALRAFSQALLAAAARPAIALQDVASDPPLLPPPPDIQRVGSLRTRCTLVHRCSLCVARCGASARGV